MLTLLILSVLQGPVVVDGRGWSPGAVGVDSPETDPRESFAAFLTMIVGARFSTVNARRRIVCCIGETH